VDRLLPFRVLSILAIEVSGSFTLPSICAEPNLVQAMEGRKRYVALIGLHLLHLDLHFCICSTSLESPAEQCG
jgi:hypothetical protein